MWTFLSITANNSSYLEVNSMFLKRLFKVLYVDLKPVLWTGF
jgi:hypothetical protein